MLDQRQEISFCCQNEIANILKNVPFLPLKLFKPKLLMK